MNSDKEQQENLPLLKAFQEFRKLANALKADVLVAYKELNQTDINDSLRPYRRRTFIRTSHAFVEGVCYGLRMFCSVAENIPGHCLTTEELDYILERPRQDGRPNYLKGDDVVKDSFKYAAKVLSLDFRLNCNHQGWINFKNSREVRDKIMHPKEIVNLNISEKEVADCHEGLQWFVAELTRFQGAKSLNLIN